MADKVIKKPRRRLKKQVRMTIGGVFMASAIAVAAIPTSSLQGGQVEAAVTVADDGKITFTHTAVAPYADTTNNKLHNEIYGVKDYTGYSDDFKNSADGIVKTYYSEGTGIPKCKADTTIYSTGNGDFQFAYVDATGDQAGSGTKTAIILGFGHEGALAGGALTIPDSVDAYLNFSDNDGSSSGFCAVGKSGNFLFYETGTTYGSPSSLYYYSMSSEKKSKTDDAGLALSNIYVWDNAAHKWNTTPSMENVNATDLAAYIADANNGIRGSSATTQAEVDAAQAANGGVYVPFYLVEGIFEACYHNFLPCYYTTYSTWVDKTIYYYETENYRPNGTAKTGAHTDDCTTPNLIPQIADVNDSSYGRISGALVTAIGKQYIESDNKNGWKIATTKDGIINDSNGKTKGIFANNSYITSLSIGENLTGISDYAFYGCTNMNSITTGNGINTLGNHAFDNCRNLQYVNIPRACNLQVIGAYCFKDCQGLKTFALPYSVTTIGDGIFKGCWAITDIDLCATGDMNGSLVNIGMYAFNDCRSLKKLEFPTGFSQTLRTCDFEGCLSLESISSLNGMFDIVERTDVCDYGWDEFLVDQADGSTVKDKFYIEAPSSGTIHTTCSEKEVAYKYPGQDVYELTKKERGRADASKQPTITYQINSANQLTNTKFNGEATSLTFPEYIGPYHIESIGDRAFQDKCSLVEVSIASTITKIGTEAFKGCHNLKYVYFDTDSVEIGDYAFMTQDVTTHAATCSTYSGKDNDWDASTTDKDINLYSAADMTDGSNNPKVKLGFVGTINVDSTPYKYAMSYDGRYNNGSQTYSFIEYYSGWPTMLTVRYNMISSETHEGYSELIDFPTSATLASYAAKDYLSQKNKDAAAKAISDKAAGKPLTEDAQIFTDSATKLTVPTGIDAIKDGLFYDLTNTIAEKMDVVLEGVDHIETGYDTDGTTPLATKSDFYNCKNLGNVILSGKEGAMNTKTVDDYAFSGAASGITAIRIDCPVDTIGKEAFKGDKDLAKVNINNSVGEIGKDAFRGCDALTKVCLDGNIGPVGDTAFEGCKELDSVEITGSVTSFGEECFANDEKLTAFTTTNTIGSIADHAFEGDKLLETVTFADEVNSLGVRPWAGCEKLSDIDFGNGTHYVCDDSIVFELSTGVKTAVVELLESRTRKVDAGELSTVTSLKPEAFMDTNVKSISLYESKVTNIPKDTFTNTTSLREVILPSAQTAAGIIINEGAFTGSHVEEITGENNISLISAKATDGIITPSGNPAVAKLGTEACTDNTNTGNNKNVTIYAPEGSVLYNYATMYDFKAETIKEIVYWTVTFRGWDADQGKLVAIGDPLRIEDGEAIDPYYIPTAGDRPDYIIDTKEPWLSSNDSSTVNEIWEDTIFTANYITPSADYGKYLVQFYYYDENEDPDHNTPILIEHQYVNPGSDATEPTKPTIPGYSFKRWSASFANVQKDLDIYAIYNTGYTVNFVYVDPTTKKSVDYQTIAVPAGGDATALVREPSIDGYVFDGWVGTPATGDLTNITMDMYATGSFTKKNSSAGGIDGVYTVTFWADGTELFSLSAPEGADLSTVSGPAKTGYKFTGWSPSPTNVTKDMDVSAQYTADSTSGTTGTNADGTGNAYYTLTVVNGSGSGTYLAGSQAIIVANDPAAGQAFGSWTITPADTKIASKGLSATVITMPTENVTVTANYVAKTGGATTNGGGTNTTPTTPNKTGTGGTTVVIDKNGLSNTGVVSATVNGSSDNFTIKVVESSAASESVLKALIAEYGDISKIIYFPMDISLYDASGDKKITDTTGLTVTITLPLPDSMIQYGGNNKVAAIMNNQVQSLSPRFTTINGVDCVTFTCTHFSPYVIYVNTEQITQAGGNNISDSTPKTGDGIQPKWFLAIGLAGIGGFMFLKRDKKKKVIA